MSNGLADVIAAKTVLSHADTENGTVWVRGHRIGELVARYGYEGTIALIWEVQAPWYGYLTVLPALFLSGLMLGAFGLLLSSTIRQLENFAGVMNFVIFPMFFASSALYPLWRVKEANLWLWYICELNPFPHAVELVRFALYGSISWVATWEIFLRQRWTAAASCWLSPSDSDCFRLNTAYRYWHMMPCSSSAAWHSR